MTRSSALLLAFPLLLAFVVGVTVAGCDSPRREATSDASVSVSPTAAPERIVSLFPSWTEALHVLGAGDRLVGRSRHCTFPEAVTSLPSVGDGWTVNSEALLRLRPDLVVVFGEHLRDRLKRLGLEVVSIRADSLDEIYAAYRRLAGLAGLQAAGDRLVARVQSRLRDVREQCRGLAAKRVLYYVDPRAGTVVGRRNFVHELLEIAGATNVVGEASTAWPTYSREAAVRSAPDVVLYGGGDLAPDDAFLRGWPGGTRLVRVEPPFVTRSGPRLDEAAILLSRLIHER